MTTYKCINCSYKCKLFNDMVRHQNRNISCFKNLEGYNYTEEQILRLSLIPYYKDNQNIDIEIIKNINKYVITKNKLFELLSNIEKNKLRHCELCYKKFTKKYDLKKHIILECVNISFEKENNYDNRDNHDNNINNTINYITNNNNYNLNITNHIHINSTVPFDKEWDVSHLNNDEKTLLIISMHKYTKTLESLLKNKNNHNVIIDKSSNSGLVYKNDIEKYIQMRSKDIVDNTMDKLKRHLLEINNNSRDSILLDCLDVSKKIIENKHENYVNNETIQKGVKDVISNIFENKKEKAIDISNNLKDNIFENLDKGF